MTDFLPQNDESWNQVAGGWRGNRKGGTEHVYDTLKTGHGEEEESEKMDLGEKKGWVTLSLNLAMIHIHCFMFVSSYLTNTLINR